jgi:hypothetical protein
MAVGRVQKLHNIDQIMVATYFRHQGWVVTKDFIEVVGYTDRALVLFVDGNFLADVVDSLDARVGIFITAATKNVPLLCKYSVETSILNAVLATIIETVEYQLSLIFDFQRDGAPAAEFIAAFIDNVGYPLWHDDEDRGSGFPRRFGPDTGC